MFTVCSLISKPVKYLGSSNPTGFLSSDTLQKHGNHDDVRDFRFIILRTGPNSGIFERGGGEFLKKFPTITCKTLDPLCTEQ